MAQPYIQTSFNSGEWSPNLNARVDIAKYRGGAALLRNFFVDYRGGASTRAGTKYIQQTYKSSTTRLIPFQASFTVSYVLEFGDLYVRFYNNGAPVLETSLVITGATQTNPVVLSVANTYTTGSVDWVYIANMAGMTQLNGGYYIVTARTANTITLAYLDGTPVDATAFGAWTSDGTSARVYTLASPYTASELAQVKFAQNVADLILCHPNHPPYKLTLVTATNWTLGAIAFGPTIDAPGSLSVATTLAGGAVCYAYVVTSVDANGQESSASPYAIINNIQDLRAVAGTNTVSWGAIQRAISYNVYKAELRYNTGVPAGAQFGYVGSVTSTTFIDSNIGPDFSTCAPAAINPFAGAGVSTVTVTNPGSYGAGVAAPTVSFAGGGGSGAAAIANLQCVSAVVVSPPAGANYNVGDTITIASGFGVVLQVTAVNFENRLTDVVVVNPGALSTGSATPTSPSPQSATSGSGFGATFTLTWALASISLTANGTSYVGAPAVTVSSGGATATAAIGASAAGNPTVPGFHQQRLVLAGPVSNPQLFNMSQPGAYYNFNITNPTLPSDAFTGTLTSGKLNTIQSMLSQPQGLVVLSDQGAWLLNSGSGTGIDATQAVANTQVFSGASGLPLIACVDDILYVQAKGSIVRDLVFNWNKQVYTGTDISVLSSHLFYGYTLLEWAFAEEPFKMVYAVRSDGQILTLTFLKEQELIAWSHCDTAGSFLSVASITETVQVGAVDAVYTIVQRTVGGNTVQYIERFVELAFPSGVIDAWCVDSGLLYSGNPATTFHGARHLAGLTVTGLADGVPITPFTMAPDGTFVLPAAASRVVIGVAFLPQLKTLQIDTGDPTIQGKEKKIPAVTLRVANTLGLQVGTTFDNLVDMDDLVLGAVGKATNALVTDLITGDAMQTLDPDWNVPGQYCIQQSLPLPATILGLMPQLTVGDTKSIRG